MHIIYTYTVSIYIICTCIICIYVCIYVYMYICICELVGTFILNKLKNVFQNNTFGLYRDDGLAVIKGLSGPEIERLKKNVIKTFKDCGLNITIEANLHAVNYLDVTFDL